LVEGLGDGDVYSHANVYTALTLQIFRKIFPSSIHFQKIFSRVISLKRLNAGQAGRVEAGRGALHAESRRRRRGRCAVGAVAVCRFRL
jgi:hypothetical protein